MKTDNSFTWVITGVVEYLIESILFFAVWNIFFVSLLNTNEISIFTAMWSVTILSVINLFIDRAKDSLK